MTRRLFPSLIVLLLLAALLAACTPSHPQSTFDTAGDVAEKQLDLLKVVFWAAVFVFVVVEGALLYAVLRYRRKPGQGIPTQTHGNTRLEIAWTIAPAIVLAVIAVPTIITLIDIEGDPPEGALQVTVIGHQWWWEFQYPEHNVITANELHLPKGQPVSLTLQSDDVIHSFWIPKLAGKVDMIPNAFNKLSFTPKEEGSFFGQCAELCGVAHAQMRFRAIVQSEADFQSWVQAQQAPSTGGSVAGATVFGVKGCGVCHTTSGPDPEGLQKSRMLGFLQGQPLFPAPNLTHFGSRTTFAGGLLDLNEDNLWRWLEDPDKVKPGNHMAERAQAYTDPDKALTRDDIAVLVKYLLSLK